MARGKVEPREIPSIFHGGAAGIFSRKNKRRGKREKENKRDGIALTKIADDKMKIMRNDVRASKEANEMSIYIYIG